MGLWRHAVILYKIVPVRVSRDKKRAGFPGRVLLGIALGALTVCLIATIVINAKFQVITASPRISHETVATPDTRTRLTLNPSLAQDYIKTRFLEGVSVPDWALELVLPQEIALMFDPDLGKGEIYITLFINDKRLAPTIIDAVERFDVPSRFSYIDWISPTLEPKGRGYLSMAGMMPMLPKAHDIVRRKWGRPPLILAMLPSRSNHLIEAVLDNRDGGSWAVLLSLLAANGASIERLTQRDVMDVLVNISEARLYADLTETEELAIHLDIKFRENTRAVLLEGFAHSFDLLAEHIRMETGDELPGSRTLDGFTFVGDYTLTNTDIWRDWAD